MAQDPKLGFLFGRRHVVVIENVRSFMECYHVVAAIKTLKVRNDGSREQYLEIDITYMDDGEFKMTLTSLFCGK